MPTQTGEVPGITPGSLVPGSFKGKVSLGTRYVPAPTPGQAAWNTFLRSYTPWGPFTADEPPTGTGGRFGQIARLLPYVCGSLRSTMAAQAAREKQGQMVPVPPATGWFQNLLTSLGNLMAVLPMGGPAATGARVGLGAASGLAGAPEFFGTSWPSVLGRAGGMGARALMERSPTRGGGPGPTAPEPRRSTAWVGSQQMDYPTYFPFVPGSSIVGTSQAYSSSPGVYNPFLNPSTGQAPPWSLFPEEGTIPAGGE